MNSTMLSKSFENSNQPNTWESVASQRLKHTCRGTVVAHHGQLQLLTYDYRCRILRMFTIYSPSKVPLVDRYMVIYKNREEELLASLVRKYGPEPSDERLLEMHGQIHDETIQFRNRVETVKSIQREANDGFSKSARSGFRSRLIYFFLKHDPEHLDVVDQLVAQGKMRQSEVIEALLRKYGPEPTDEEITMLERGMWAGVNIPQSDFRTRLYHFYLKYNPSMLMKMDATLAKSKGQEEELMRELTKKYGPEPTDLEVITITGRSGDGRGLDYRTRFQNIYLRYKPEKFNKVEKLLVRYQGREAELLKELTEKYGPEPGLTEAQILRSAYIEFLRHTKDGTPLDTVSKSGAAHATVTPSRALGHALQQPDSDPPTSFSGQSLHNNVSGASVDHLSGLPSNRIQGTSKSMQGKPALVGITLSEEQESFSSVPAPPTDYRSRMVAMYLKYRPEKLDDVDHLLNAYKGKEMELLNTMVEKYGPEPTPDELKMLLNGKYGNIGIGKLSYRERLVRFYERYNPEKLNTVDMTLSKYRGHEEDVIKSLIEKYGPEPPARGGQIQNLSVRDRIEYFYLKHNPDKLFTVDDALSKYKGREEEVLKTLVDKYGAEPTAEEVDILMQGPLGQQLNRFTLKRTLGPQIDPDHRVSATNISLDNL